MIATDYKTITYRHGDYLIDLVSKQDEYEAWIYVENDGDKHFMFGMPKEQQSYFEFMKIVEANIPEYEYLCATDDGTPKYRIHFEDEYGVATVELNNYIEYSNFMLKLENDPKCENIWTEYYDEEEGWQA